MASAKKGLANEHKRSLGKQIMMRKLGLVAERRAEEAALVEAVAEAAVVGRPDDIKGQAIAAFVTIKDREPTEELRQELRMHVRKQIGALAQPDEIRFAAGVPKTRSGKIMRRLLRDIAAGRESAGDTSTLEDFSVLASLRAED